MYYVIISLFIIRFSANVLGLASIISLAILLVLKLWNFEESYAYPTILAITVFWACWCLTHLIDVIKDQIDA